jgi:hypothetical protein
MESIPQKTPGFGMTGMESEATRVTGKTNGLLPGRYDAISGTGPGYSQLMRATTHDGQRGKVEAEMTSRHGAVPGRKRSRRRQFSIKLDQGRSSCRPIKKRGSSQDNPACSHDGVRRMFSYRQNSDEQTRLHCRLPGLACGEP